MRECAVRTHFRGEDALCQEGRANGAVRTCDGEADEPGKCRLPGRAILDAIGDWWSL